jgi:xylulokinase
MPLVVGVDSSTSGTKVVLVDAADGTTLGASSSPHPPTTPPRSEQPPAAWWAALETATQQLHADQDTAKAVTGMAVAGQQHGLVALDESGRALRPAKLWNDTEATSDGHALVERLGGPAEWIEACGSVPIAAFTIAKLAWLRRVEPDVFSQLASVALPHDWLTLQLTGHLVTDRGDASGTGYWSPHEDRWRPDLLELIDLQRDWAAALPTVLGPSDAAGALTPDASTALGLGRDTVVGPGTGDNMAAALGLNLHPGDVAISVGTSGTVFAVTDAIAPRTNPSVAGFADASGRFLPLVCTMNASKVSDTFARLLGVSRGEFDDLAVAASPGAGGVSLLPYLDGERTPDRPTATGMLAGLRNTTTTAEIARAAIEGVICGLLDALDALASTGVETSGRLLLTGGAARSTAYGQVLADLSDRRVEVASAEELVARGAAAQAAAVLAGVNPAAVAAQWKPTPTRVVEPNGNVDIDEIRGRYAQLRD